MIVFVSLGFRAQGCDLVPFRLGCKSSFSGHEALGRVPSVQGQRLQDLVFVFVGSDF